jgi:endonuclease-3 related protein
MKQTKIHRFYQKLLALYGPQGWWPVASVYHKGDYEIPSTRKGAFEVCMGAILTQNTAWTQVERALANLQNARIDTPEKLLKTDKENLAELIRPSGYCNQKSLYLYAISEWFILNYGTVPERENLLAVRGVGPETADSILLYAFHLPTFVIDTYTRRICAAEGLADARLPYEKLRALFQENLPRDVCLYKEYHALLVEHAKNQPSTARQTRTRSKKESRSCLCA